MAGESKPLRSDKGSSQRQSESLDIPSASKHNKNAKEDHHATMVPNDMTISTYDELPSICTHFQMEPHKRIRFAQPATPPFSDDLGHPPLKDHPECGSVAADRLEPLVHTRWPPKGQIRRTKLSEEQALALVNRGALSFAGLFFQASHVDSDHKRFYATTDVEGAEHDALAIQQPCDPSNDMSLVLFYHGGHIMPWETLEQQPSMSVCFGQLPGTVALNQYVSQVDRPLHRAPCPDHYVVPRHTAHVLVLQRLHFLQDGLDHDPDFTEDLLFSQLICDPEWVRGEALQLPQQIPMLIAALDNPVWIDFREPCTQILARSYDNHDVEVEQRFYHQLLLSVELYLRLVEFTHHFDKKDVRSLLAGINEKVAYDLTLAQIWLEKMTFEPIDGGFLRPPTRFRITALTKNKQRERLLHFASEMKWAGIIDVQRMLEETDEGVIPLEGKSPWSSSWIAGAIFPGTSSSWLMMRSLIDCDPDLDNVPHGFDQMPSNFGFQYRGSTYWYWESIVGKVIAASRGVKQSYGWIGPCLQSGDLMRLQTLQIHSASPTKYLTKSRVKNMAARTAALGPPTDSYAIDEFVLPLPDFDNIVDWVRVQKLAFKRHSDPTSATEPITYCAAVVFAVENETIPIRLRYDVSFIYIPPCRGQHILFWDYAYETANVDDLLDLHSWNGVDLLKKPPGETSLPPETKITASEISAATNSPLDAGFSSSSPSSSKSAKSKPDVESVLVVETFGSADNEVLARAWASHVGFSAVITNVKQTCMACSIRAAYAAAVPMVILNKGRKEHKRQGAAR